MSEDDSVVFLGLPLMSVTAPLILGGIRTIAQLRLASDSYLLALPYISEQVVATIRQRLALYDSRGRLVFVPADLMEEIKGEGYEQVAKDAITLRSLSKREQQEQAILLLHQKGKTARQIAEKVGLSRQQVYVYLTRLGMRPHLNKHTAILEAHERGLTPHQIAGQLHVSLSMVYNVLKRHSQTPNSLPPRPTVREAVLKRHAEGMRPNQIAQELGVSVQTVYEHLRHSLT